MTVTITPPTALTRWQKWLLAVTTVGFAPLAAISFWGSYSALQAEAVRRGFIHDQAWVVPIGVDAGIIGLSVWDLLLTSLRKPWPLLRHLVLVLTGATIWFNAAAGHDAVGMGMHGVLPLLFIIYIKAFRHLLKRRSAESAGILYEGIPWARWLWAPWSTLLMKRRMALWGETNYERAVATEQAIRRTYAQLRQKFGRAWKEETPDDIRWMLRTGVHVEEACEQVAELTRPAASPPPAIDETATPAAADGGRPPSDENVERTGDNRSPKRRTASRDNDSSPRGRTFIDAAEPHYLECKAKGTPFDLKLMEELYGGSEGNWRKVRKQLIERHGDIGTPAPSDDTLDRPIRLQREEARSADEGNLRSA